MKQQLKMLGHFGLWAVKSLAHSFINSFKELRTIHVSFYISYIQQKENFKTNLAMAFLSFVLSLMMTFGLVSFIGSVIFYGAYDEHKDEFLPWITYSLLINVVGYTICFIHAMYEKFLDDYESTWNILKDEHKE